MDTDRRQYRCDSGDGMVHAIGDRHAFLPHDHGRHRIGVKQKLKHRKQQD